MAVGRGRRRGSAIRGAAATVNSGSLSVASAAPDAQSEVSAVDVAKAMKETKKKLLQIEDVVEKTGKTLSNEERG